MFERWFLRAAAEGADRGVPRVSDPGRMTPDDVWSSERRNMEEIVNLFHGFAVVLQPFNILVMVIGILLGVIIGVLPGLGGANGVAILLPLTFSHVADLGDHHAVLHLLGRAVRRRHHLGAVQHSGRAVVGGDHLRRPSDGAAGPGRRGADRRLHLVLRRRAVRRHHDHAGRAAGRQVRAAVRAGGEVRASISWPSAASSA